MGRFLKYIISKERTMMVLLVFLLIAGGYAYWSMPKEAQPDIPFPDINVSVSLPGISPEDAERLLIKPLEKELKSISGVKKMTAWASEGYASIGLRFDVDFDMSKALRAVKDRVDLSKENLPKNANTPIVREWNTATDPVLSIGLSGNLPERTLLRLARELRDEIKSLPQVLDVEIIGDRYEVVEIIINPERLQTYHLTPLEIGQLIRSNNQLVSAGTWDVGSGRFPFKVKGLIEGWEELVKMPVKVVGDKVIVLEDIATIRNTFTDPGGFARIGGKPALVLEVKKRIGENIIATIEAIKGTVELVKEDWPQSVDVAFFKDESNGIRIQLGELKNSLMTAIILVMVVTIASLGIRSGVLIGVAIPGSFLIGILILYLMGVSINVVVLFGLILASGMLVDGAIIVIEYADRKMAEGISKKEAYILAAQQMVVPVVSSIITTIVAFVPLIFWPGMMGEYMKFLPLTMIATLTASIFMALIFVPILGMLFGKRITSNSKELKQSLDLEEGSLDVDGLKGMTGRYIRVLKKLIERPGKVILFAVFFLMGIYLLYVLFGKGVILFPDSDDDNITFNVRMRGDLSVLEADRLLKEVEEKLLDMKELAVVYSKSFVSTGDLRGHIFAELIDWKKRRKADEIIRDVKKRTEGISGVIVRSVGGRGPVAGKPIKMDLLSNFPELLPPTVAKISDHLKTMEGLKDIEDTRPIPGIEWKIEIDRQEASKFGASAQLVGEIIRLVTNGLKVTDYTPDDAEDEVDIRLRYPVDNRGLLAIEHLRIPTETGSIPLSNFVRYTPVQKVNVINRLNGKRVMEIEAGVNKGVLANDKVKEIQQWLVTEADIDPRVKVEFKGEDEEQKEAQAFLPVAFLIALGLMSIALVTQFNSLYYPFLILTGVIFSTVGVVLGLLITRQPFIIVMNGIGIIALAGIIINNNIVLIDTFLKIKKATDISVKEAVLRTCAQRLRPVILTVITATLGVLPMVFALDFDFIGREITYDAPSAQWWRGLSTSIAFGLMFGTVLTLVLTPCMLMLGENVIQWFKKKFSHRTKISST